MNRTVAVALLLLLLAPARTGFAQAAPERPSSKDEGVWLRMERDLEDGNLEPVAARACRSESSLRSLTYDTPTVLRFKNATAGDVTFFWVNYEGKRDQKWVVKAGEVQNIRTYLTHPFVVVDASGACAAVYMPRREPGLVVIADAPK